MGVVQDPAPMKPVVPPKAVTVEDSFKSCSTPTAAAHVLKRLAPDLLARLQEEVEANSITLRICPLQNSTANLAKETAGHHKMYLVSHSMCYL